LILLAVGSVLGNRHDPHAGRRFQRLQDRRQFLRPRLARGAAVGQDRHVPSGQRTPVDAGQAGGAPGAGHRQHFRVTDDLGGPLVAGDEDLLVFLAA